MLFDDAKIRFLAFVVSLTDGLPVICCVLVSRVGDLFADSCVSAPYNSLEIHGFSPDFLVAWTF